MAEESKVLDFKKPEETEQESSNPGEANDAVNSLGLDPDKPLSDENMAMLNGLLKNIRKSLDVVENIWFQTRDEFKLSASLVSELWVYNENHKKPKPADVDEKDWNFFNGLTDIPEDEIERIFGEDHPIIGVHPDQTRDRIQTVMNDFYSWSNLSREYSETDRQYRILMEMKEDQNMMELQAIANNEKDPAMREAALAAIDEYKYRKYLDFMAEPMSDRDKKRLIDAFGDGKKVDYWITRTRDKLKQMAISQEFILEISKFEDRFLPEKYHKLSNMTLLYFMNTVTYGNVSDPKSRDRGTITAMVMAFDSVIRNVFSADVRQRVLNNIMGLLDQLIDGVYAKYYPGETPLDRPNSPKHYPYETRVESDGNDVPEVPPICE